MPCKVIELLETNFTLTATDKTIMEKNTRELSRSERTYYFQQLKPRERDFKQYLKEVLHTADQQEIKHMVVNGLLERQGEPSIAQGILMDVLGRLEVYKELREKAEEKGVKLKALTNFGGIGMVIALVGLVSALILYFLGH